MRSLMKHVLLLGNQAAAGITPPVIASSAVIGTALDAGAGYTSYQWQRNTGTWIDIGGATNQTYTPSDADFGYSLRVVPAATVSAASNETSLTREKPAQSIGTELVADGDMEADNTSAWGANNGGILSKETSSPYAGSRNLRITYGGNEYGLGAQALSASVGSYNEVAGVRRSDGVAKTYPAYRNGVPVIPESTNTEWNGFRVISRQIPNSGLIAFINRTTTASSYSEYDAVSVRTITLNEQLAAPSANMCVEQLYALPAVPVAGDQVRLMARISDFANGNYWLARLYYADAQWSVQLFSSAAHTLTSRIAAVTDIGTSNGLRINMDGDDISMYTTADGGDNWTQRGSAISNNLYNTATGVNSMWTSAFTIGEMAYAAPL